LCQTGVRRTRNASSPGVCEKIWVTRARHPNAWHAGPMIPPAWPSGRRLLSAAVLRLCPQHNDSRRTSRGHRRPGPHSINRSIFAFGRWCRIESARDDYPLDDPPRTFGTRRGSKPAFDARQTPSRYRSGMSPCTHSWHGFGRLGFASPLI